MAESPYLPNDIIINIFSRLPVKTLLRFRCVCKSWLSLIADPSFITTHFNEAYTRKNSSHYLVLSRSSGSSPSDKFSLHSEATFTEGTSGIQLEFPFEYKPLNLMLVGSCNGLVCVHFKLNSGFSKLCLWNPAIRKFKELPDSAIHSARIEAIGFGFTPQIYDYKVVRILRSTKSEDPYEVDVYSLKLKCWKRMAYDPSCTFGPLFSSAYFNGSIHWQTSRRELNNVRYFILSFDMADEVFKEVELPQDNSYDAREQGYLMVFQESLSVVNENEHSNFDVWVMKDYGVVESWTKYYTINKLALISYPRSFLRNGEILFQNIHDWDLFIYNPLLQLRKDFVVPGVDKFEDMVLLDMENLVLFD